MSTQTPFFFDGSNLLVAGRIGIGTTNPTQGDLHVVGIMLASSNIVTSAGRIGVGTTSPTQPLHVIGNILASSDITAFSDSNYKTDIRPITGALDKLSNLTGYTFLRRDDPTKKRAVGLIAQEVEKVLPEAVHINDGALSIAYGNIVGLLVQAIKEQHDQHNRDIAAIWEAIEEIRLNR